ncbi:hypothetical protein GCM10009844_22530 [Nocardioides koreensis]|uniref:Integrase n=2 Tax=Nocardioides koreensis TaxID=433651 RepID=A0ABN2ZSM9_9ACTN
MSTASATARSSRAATDQSGSRGKKRTLLADVGRYTVAEAAAAAAELWPGLGALPGDQEPVLRSIDRIAKWADLHGIEALADLAGEIVTEMVADLCEEAFSAAPTPQVGVSMAHRQNQFLLDRAHTLRNLCSALRTTVLIARPGPLGRRSQRVQSDTIDVGLPGLPDRTGFKGRPLRKDETLLNRLMIELDIREQATVQPLHLYLLAETGVAGTAGSRAVVGDLDHPLTPTSITVAGLRGRGPRTIPLDPWVQGVFARTLPRTRGGAEQPLTYSGDNIGKASAGSSTGPALMRQMRRAGITGTDIQAKSLTKWRCDHTLCTTGDIEAALVIHGGTRQNLFDALGYTKDELDSYSGLLHILDTNGAVVGQMPAHQWNNARPHLGDGDAAPTPLTAA